MSDPSIDSEALPLSRDEIRKDSEALPLSRDEIREEVRDPAYIKESLIRHLTEGLDIRQFGGELALKLGVSLMLDTSNSQKNMQIKLITDKSAVINVLTEKHTTTGGGKLLRCNFSHHKSSSTDYTLMNYAVHYENDWRYKDIWFYFQPKDFSSRDLTEIIALAKIMSEKRFALTDLNLADSSDINE